MQYAILSILSGLKGLLSRNGLFLSVEVLCLLLKGLLFWRVKSGKIDQNHSKAFYFLTLILASSAFIDVSMILYYLRCEPFGYIPVSFSRVVNRLDAIAWAIQFFAFIPFFRELSSRKIPKRVVVVFLIPAVLFSLGYLARVLYIIFFSRNSEYLAIDEFMDKTTSYYILCAVIGALLIIHHNYKKCSLEIIKSQNFILGAYFVGPYLIERLGVILFSFLNFDLAFSPKTASFTSLFFTCMLWYSFSKLFNLRFLNSTNHVLASSSKRFKLIDDFKYILAKFPKVQKGNELADITKEFFELAFKIPRSKICLLLNGKLYNRDEDEGDVNATRRIHLDELLKAESDNAEILKLVRKNKILITDEVEFTDFYGSKEVCNGALKRILQFLKQNESDLILPIFCAGKFSGAIVIDRHARDKRLFTDVERDQMILFGDYLSSIVYMLLYKDVEAIIEEKEFFKSGMYNNEKLLGGIRRSIGGFLENGETDKVGVLVYKNKKFLSCNKDAHDLVKVDLNKDKGLLITKKITELALESSKFFIEKKVIVKTLNGEVLVVKATPNVEKSNTVITVTKPNVADIIKKDCTLLRNSSQWDSLLNLRMTKEGEYVNTLIPADTRELLNLKVSFLEKAMTKKALLFELSNEDAETFAHVAHQISGRSVMESVDATDGEELAHRLFGVNREMPGLLKKLDKKGTLFLQNVHMLSKNLQKRLCEFISTGMYSSLEDRLESDVLLIFASNQNIHNLVEKGLLSRNFYRLLSFGEVSLPSFSLMDTQEVLALAEGLRKKLVANKLYSNLLVLNDSDKNKIIESKCASLYELSKKVKHLVFLKTKKEFIDAKRVMDPAYGVADFELVEVARLGKDALKDSRAMEVLMSKFKGNKNQIAEFLGVNRSSVGRRVDQYNLAYSNKNK